MTLKTRRRNDISAAAKKRWVLVTEAGKAFGEAGKFLCNLDYLFSDGKSEKAPERLLGLCERYLGGRGFDRVCNLKGEIVRDLKQLPEDLNAIVALRKGEVGFRGFSQEELAKLNEYIEHNVDCKRLFPHQQHSLAQPLAFLIRSSDPSGNSTLNSSRDPRLGASMGSPMRLPSLGRKAVSRIPQAEENRAMSIGAVLRSRPILGTYSANKRQNESSKDAATEQEQASGAVRKSMQRLRRHYGLDKDKFYDLFTQFMCLLGIDKSGSYTKERQPEHKYCISKQVVTRFNQYLIDRPADVQDRLLFAGGLLCSCGKINAEGFVRLDALITSRSGSKSERGEFWSKYVDPADMGTAKLDDFCRIMAYLTTRGTEGIGSAGNMYARRLKEELRRAECVRNGTVVDVRKMKDGLINGLIDEQLFCDGFRTDLL